MIYTITFNPALDYTVQVEEFEIGKINRTKSENILAGGKGLNVSIILKRLGIENTALSFIAGFTGKELERKIKQYNIKTDFIEINNGYTRINVKISSLKKNSLIQERETALNGNGPEITQEDIDELLEKIKKINSEDIVILSGNVPKCINEDIYEIICKELNEKNVKFVVDASQKLLMNCLKYKPFFIKPNKDELEETFNTKIKTKRKRCSKCTYITWWRWSNITYRKKRSILFKYTKRTSYKYSRCRRLNGCWFCSRIFEKKRLQRSSKIRNCIRKCNSFFSRIGNE